MAATGSYPLTCDLKDHPDWKIHEIARGHKIMLDRPQDLTSLLPEEAI
jgi:hypothetical protein